MSNRADFAGESDILIRTVDTGRQHIRVAVRSGSTPPPLLGNGIGANIELLFPLMRALDGIETIAFAISSWQQHLVIAWFGASSLASPLQATAGWNS